MLNRQWVKFFAEGSAQERDLLGGKGANLAEMVGLGLPVPPGFTVTVEACRSYLSLRRRNPGRAVGRGRRGRRRHRRADRPPLRRS